MAETGRRCEQGGVTGLVTKPARTSNKERYALSHDNVVSYRQKDGIDDPLTESCKLARAA